jgi:uncharacterized lipoprotein NlpE involved in copper resistance
MEINMKKTMLSVFAAVAIALTGSQSLLLAQGNHNMEGTWDVAVTVVDCQSGAAIRTVRSLQMYSLDGSFSETANTFLRGSSVGKWDHAHTNVYTATYNFFRYNADGSFKSIADALNKVELSGDGSHFTATGTITDYDATGNQISLGCVTQAARRLTALAN